MSLESAIQSLADELKRYNDGRTGTDATSATPAPEAPKTAKTTKAEKPEPAPKVDKPAAEPVVTFDEVQEQAVDFVNTHPEKREALVAVLKECNVQPVDMGGKMIFKISAAKDNPKLLAKISAALAASLAEATP